MQCGMNFQLHFRTNDETKLSMKMMKREECSCYGWLYRVHQLLRRRAQAILHRHPPLLLLLLVDVSLGEIRFIGIPARPGVRLRLRMEEEEEEEEEEESKRRRKKRVIHGVHVREMRDEIDQRV